MKTRCQERANINQLSCCFRTVPETENIDSGTDTHEEDTTCEVHVQDDETEAEYETNTDIETNKSVQLASKLTEEPPEVKDNKLNHIMHKIPPTQRRYSRKWTL